MKNILFISTFLFTVMLFSQNQSVIRGSVTDKVMNNEPMHFANIELEGSDTSYQTNFHGNFEISNIEPGFHTLTISYAGYQTEEITIRVEKNSTSQIATVLSPMKFSFEDVTGMDTASIQETVFPANSEKSPKK